MKHGPFLQIRLDIRKKIWQEIKVKALMDNTTVSAIVDEAVRAYLKSLEKAKTNSK